MKPSIPSWPLSLLCVALVLGTAALAGAANVRGKLLLGAYKPPSQPEPCYWEVENGFKEIARERLDARRELAAVLVGNTQGDGRQPPAVELNGGSLLPATVVVRPGVTLRIRNDDQIAHELYVPGLDGFSAEATSPGAVRTVPVSKAGNWPILDRLVPHVRGHLHVIEDLVAVAEIQSAGEFVFTDVPPGSYTLTVFHGADEIASKTIEVQERGDVTLDPLTLTAPNS